MKCIELNRLIDQASTALLQSKEGESNQLLSQVFDELLVLSPSLSPETLVMLAKIMEIMHDAQQRRDHVYLVDILKYELPKHLTF